LRGAFKAYFTGRKIVFLSPSPSAAISPHCFFQSRVFFHAVSNCSNPYLKRLSYYLSFKVLASFEAQKRSRKKCFGKRLATLSRRLLISPDSLTSLLLYFHLTHVDSYTYRPGKKPFVASWRPNCEMIGGLRRSIDTLLTSCGYIRPSLTLCGLSEPAILGTAGWMGCAWERSDGAVAVSECKSNRRWRKRRKLNRR